MAARKVPISNRNLVNLIEEVRKRPCIWNVTDVYYNERGHIASAWGQISATLKLPEDFLRAKWKNLRDLFKREKKKFDVQSLDTYTGKWRHFRYLWFLHRPDDHVEFNYESASDTDIKDENSDKLVQADQTGYEVYIDDAELRLGNKRLACEMEDSFLEKRMRHDDEDYDLMFLKSLTPYFRDLEHWRKLIVRNKIQDILISELAAQSNYSIQRD